MGAPSGVV